MDVNVLYIGAGQENNINIQENNQKQPKTMFYHFRSMMTRVVEAGEGNLERG